MRFVSLFCIGVACLPLFAQEGPVIRSTAQEVLLDVVARDKKERLIRNLKPEEIRVLEDGVPQKVTAFHFTDAETEEAPTAPEPAPAAGRSAGPKPAVQGPALNPPLEAHS